jgi:ferric-dicitrate binding protein FerR (iron transport regulator)
MNDSLLELGRRIRPLQEEKIARTPALAELSPDAFVARTEQLAERRVRRRWMLTSGAVGAASLAALGLWLAQPGALSVEVAGAKTDAGATFEAARAELHVHFSDGTAFTLSQDSQAALGTISDRGAFWILTQGALHAEVVPREGNDWRVAAGPFEVRVLGTIFDVRWDPNQQSFALQVARGKVAVRGPTLDAPRTVFAGERLTLSLASDDPAGSATPSTEHSVGEASTEATKTDAPATDAPATDANNVSTDNSPTGPVPAEGARKTQWRKLASQGEHRKAWASAKREGIAENASQLSAKELLELADVARLAGSSGAATKYLHAVRQRFGGTGAAAVAAYTLGVMAFDQRGDYPSAARWFSTYLSEEPGGSLASDALGRLMEAQSRSGNQAAAKATARRYLEAYPNGLHQDVASRLTGRR